MNGTDIVKQVESILTDYWEQQKEIEMPTEDKYARRAAIIKFNDNESKLNLAETMLDGAFTRILARRAELQSEIIRGYEEQYQMSFLRHQIMIAQTNKLPKLKFEGGQHRP